MFSRRNQRATPQNPVPSSVENWVKVV